MPQTTPAKKTIQVLLRLEQEIGSEFFAALAASNLSAQEALRLAVVAMIACQKKYGRIPRDMELSQALLGGNEHALEQLQRLISRMPELAGYAPMNRAGLHRLNEDPAMPADGPARDELGEAEATSAIMKQPAALARRRESQRRGAVAKQGGG